MIQAKPLPGFVNAVILQRPIGFPNPKTIYIPPLLGGRQPLHRHLSGTAKEGPCHDDGPPRADGRGAALVEEA